MARQDANTTGRRNFIAAAGKALLLAGFPTIVPASILGRYSPGNRINIGAIGTGRISRVHDLPGIWVHDATRIMAVCDLDSKRVQDAVTLVNGYYARQTGKPYDGVTAYANYRELLANKDVDAVVISTPDHWHALSKEPIAPVEVAHRACSTCLLHHMAMKLNRKLFWDPVAERFKNDDQANAMRSRAQRPSYVCRGCY